MPTSYASKDINQPQDDSCFLVTTYLQSTVYYDLHNMPSRNLKHMVQIAINKDHNPPGLSLSHVLYYAFYTALHSGSQLCIIMLASTVNTPTVIKEL